MAKEKILFVTQEITPYLPADHLSTLGKNIPQAIQGKGYEVRAFMPKYGAINERRNQLHEVIRLSGVNIPIDDNDHPLIIKVATLQPTRMQVYFIDNDDYFQHQPVKDLETVSDAAVNDERIMFFTRGVIETVKKLRWDPKVIHCMGWITALVPLYLRRQFADDITFKTSKIVYTLRNDAFEGPLDARFAEKMKMAGFTDEHLAVAAGRDFDYILLNKLAIDNADAIVVSTDDVLPELIDYARASGKPFLPYPGSDEQLAAEFTDLYAALTDPANN